VTTYQQGKEYPPMPGERLGKGIVAALIACLSVGILLLGIELSQAVGGGGRLPPTNTAVLAAAALMLYAALAWRSSQGRGQGLFVRCWGSMIAGHALLGITVGLASATLVSSPAEPAEIAQWAGAASLPMLVLQAGYSIGVSALAWGEGEQAVVPLDAIERTEPAAVEATPPLTLPPPEAEESPRAPAPHLEVYASAIERLRANDHQALIRFATQAAKCEGGLLATNDGLVVAAVQPKRLDASRVAAFLPDLVRSLERLAGPGSATGAPAMLHAALGGYELLAVPGQTLTGCLIGPEPGAREVAEVILPVLVARADELGARNALGSADPHTSADGPPTNGERPW
jgi:hypothetical protein